ncbi:efflux RND transporter permease subunit [bacterium]|nr:efflux RND transporter permease subunit [bacterium]
MFLSNFSVKRPVAITMIVMVFVVLGLVSLIKMPVEFIPDIYLPVIFLSANYPGVGPQEIEKLVTKPLEMAVSRAAGIKNVSSTSRLGNCSMQLEFKWGTDLDQAMTDIREMIEQYKDGFLPEDMENPMLLKYDPSSIPVSVHGINSDKRTMRELRKMAEDLVQPYLEQLDGVGSVWVWGGGFREISVQVDQKRLMGVGLSLDRLVQQLRAENLDISSGHIVQGGRDYQVKSRGEFESLDDIKNVVVTVVGGVPVRLRDIATVIYAPVEETAFARMQGQNSTVVAIMKQSDANTVEVSKRVRKELSRIEKRLPADVAMSELFDSATYIQASVNNVRNAALFGAILAVLVLFLFLRSYRASFIIGTAIPISVLITFFPLYFLGISINIISLGGLAIGIGMLVDNSIVVLENIYRRLQGGEDRNTAASKGAAQVAMAITASTLTTMVIFIPILFTAGVVKILFGQLAASIAFSLSASLIVALTLVPMISAKLLNQKATARIVKAQSFIDPIRRIYLRVLNNSLNHRVRILLFALILFVGSLFLVPAIGVDFMPQSDEGIFQIFVTLPAGSPLEETKALMTELEDYLFSLPATEVVFDMGGEAGDATADQVANVATMIVRLVDRDKRDVTTMEVVDVLRDTLRQIGRAKFQVATMDQMQGSAHGDVEIKVSGQDFDVLKNLAQQIESRLGGVLGIKETTSSVEEANPEIRWVVDREKAANLGLGAFQIGQTIQTALQGKVATRVEKYGTEIDIRVQLAENQRNEIERLGSVMIHSPLGIDVPLRQVARMEYGQMPAKLYRENQMRVALIGGNIGDRDLRSTMTDVRREMDKIRLPDGYLISYSGEDESMRESMQDLIIDFIFAALLVYMIMAALFESFVHPFTIMFSIPFAVTGALLALFVAHLIMGSTITVNALIGIVMLLGIVVNNAIVLLDYVQRARESGLNRRDALIKAGGVRLRPILLTALTTILGLTPLAIGMGEGSEVRAPMAIAVIGGLTVSTLLTLVVVPVIYTYTDSFAERVKNRLLWIVHREKKATVSSGDMGAADGKRGVH